MTIDERLDRLTERHEALTQAVELIAGMQRAGETRLKRNEELMERLLGASENLTQIVTGHEKRLNRFDGGDPERN